MGPVRLSRAPGMTDQIGGVNEVTFAVAEAAAQPGMFPLGPGSQRSLPEGLSPSELGQIPSSISTEDPLTSPIVFRENLMSFLHFIVGNVMKINYVFLEGLLFLALSQISSSIF